MANHKMISAMALRGYLHHLTAVEHLVKKKEEKGNNVDRRSLSSK